MYIYFQDLFDLYKKQISKIDVPYNGGEIGSSGERKRNQYACVCWERESVYMC